MTGRKESPVEGRAGIGQDSLRLLRRDRGGGSSDPPAATPSLLARALLALVRLYQVGLSPLLGPRCRFEPTCSQYMAEALRIHGVWRGGLLGLWRLLRCHPLAKSGYDPVPETGAPQGAAEARPPASSSSKNPLRSNILTDDTSNGVRLHGGDPQEKEEEAPARKGRSRR